LDDLTGAESADFSQLGVNNQNAIYNGGLSGKSQFFGSGTSEIIGSAIQIGGWNGDHARAPYSTNPWLLRGAEADRDQIAGIFAFSYWSGAAYLGTSGHRTILSGY
jgi:hypothetical protein